jgi:flagellar biogenesis protein FliO
MDTARQTLAVFFVLLLLGAALWTLRRGTGPLSAAFTKISRDQGQSLQVVGRVALTPQHSLHIVRAGEREWVLATHPQGCTVISSGTASGASA